MINYLMKVFLEILYLGAISSILIVLILLIKKIFGKILSPKWHYYIWILLMIRLLIPYTPESSLSALNLLNRAAVQFKFADSSIINSPLDVFKFVNITGSNLANHSEVSSDTDSSNHIDTGNKNVVNDPVINTNIPDTVNQNQNILKSNSPGTERISYLGRLEFRPLIRILTYLWLLGMFLLTVYIMFINIMFSINVRKNYKPINNSRINDILKECKQIVGIKRTITLLTSNKTRTPSLYASYHTKILVSETYLETLSNQEIKYIFLHELVHYKRNDIGINWILTFLQIVYFFHPLIWFAFHKIHEDCEISCDADALKYLREDEYQSYGTTVIKLIKLFSESNFIPATAGLWKHKSNYRRRILMISNFKKSNWRNTFVTIVIIMIIGMIGLTGCKNSDQAGNSKDTTEPTVTSEETESSSVTEAEVTPTPAPVITEIGKSSETSDQITIKYLADLIGLSKDKLISKLGEEYNKVDEGGLEFKKQGIRVWFDEKNLINQVYTKNTDIDFNGTKVGDTIEIFKKVFGNPIDDNNGNALFKYDDYYLDVFYDTDTEKTFAVYLVTEEVAAPEQRKEASASNQNQKESASADSSQNAGDSHGNETFYGDWVIDQVIAYGSAGTYSKEAAKSLIGKGMSFSKDSATCFGDDPSYIDKTIKNPTYKPEEITSSDFEVNYRMTLKNLGITSKSVFQITASDAEGNGCTFLIKDDNTLIVIGGGTYFELVRNE